MSGLHDGRVHICEQCGGQTQATPQAPHKRFCSGKCRIAFWRQARKMGAAALAVQRGAA